ncbi:hypothetical protein CDAR_458812 [Caerostris darwini]|uniref:Heme-binding protein n=1 Tax=Caerostris darwini TaxID=1538125 RepID=A0AAV4MQ47_9ARAC|nr:hypothetical protein CDAR_458812 [Caerostris darwini]
MGMRILFIVALAFILAEGGCKYKGRECLNYTVLSKGYDYEIRSYPAVTWVVTNERNRLGLVAESKGSKRLSDYFDTKNNESVKINKTIPLRIKTSHRSPYNFEIAFPIPADMSSNPPAPIDLRLRIIKEPPTVYAIKSFFQYSPTGSGVPDETWEMQAKKLARLFKEDDTIQKTTYFRVIYVEPSLFTESRIEVWMVKDPEE